MKYFILMVWMVLLINCLWAEDWTTTDGKIYKNVTVKKSDAIYVTIFYEDGIASIPLDHLNVDLQKRFGYDPVKAQAQKIAEELQKQSEADELAKLAANQASSKAREKSIELCSGNVIQVLPNGVLSSVDRGLDYLEVCFIECDSSQMIDGQFWQKRILSTGTYSYTDNMGAKCTVAKFSFDLSKDFADWPPMLQRPISPRPVSDLGSVGGG